MRYTWDGSLRALVRPFTSLHFPSLPYSSRQRLTFPFPALRAASRALHRMASSLDYLDDGMRRALTKPREGNLSLDFPMITEQNHAPIP